MHQPDVRGRAREYGLLRRGYDAREASIRWVAGLAGVGKTTTVRGAAADFHTLYHRAPPLSDPQQRAALAATLATTRARPAGGGAAPPDASWDQLFDSVVDGSPEGRPTVLVIDDAHRWLESRARFAPALSAAILRARKLERPLHVTLVAPEVPPRSSQVGEAAPPLLIRPLHFRAALPFLPGATSAHRLLAWAVFGGIPGILRTLDSAASLGTNVRRLILSPGAPLQDHPLHMLERRIQTPTRYAAILRALSGGEADWGDVHAGVADLTSSGQAGPYLKRLEELGLLEVRQSLDAGPRTRSRRYRTMDPFLAFWFRLILPHRERLSAGDGESLLAEVIRPGLGVHLASVFAQACRDYMTHDAMERLGSHARECGSLWGTGYGIPIAGVLTSGSPFYGTVAEEGTRTGRDALAALDAAMRETRYGFGRERRLRLLFVPGTVPSALQREGARRQDTLVLGLEALAGVDA